MTEVVGIQKENVGDRKWLFIICCIIIILILTSAILWINSQQTEPEQFQPTPPAGSEIYSKFGFSFFYPEDMYVFETGLMDGDNPNADSGSVVGTLQKSKNQAFTLQWMKSEPVDLVASSHELLIDIHLAGVLISEIDDAVFSNINGHPLVYQEFTAENFTPIKIDGDGYAVSGVWYCPDREILYNLIVTQSSSAGIISSFNQYVDSFNCH